MKRLRNWIVCIMIIAILSLLLAVSHMMDVNAEGKLTVQNPLFVVGSNPIYTIQAGTVAGKATVVNNSSQPQSAILITALYKSSTNEIVDINYQKADNIAQNASQTLTASIANVPSSSGYYMMMYLWNNIDQAQSLTQVYKLTSAGENTPPEVPANLTWDSTKTTSEQVYLKWDVPEDNLVTVGYSVYRNGMKIADVNQPYILDNDENLVFGTQYTYTVKAYDAIGAYSGMSTSINAATANIANAGSIILGSSNSENNITNYFASNHLADPAWYAYNTVDTIGGLQCRKIASGKRICFKFTDSFANSIGPNVRIKITYYDTGSDRIRVSYVGKSNRYTDKYINKTNTNTWKTYVLDVTDAKWDHTVPGTIGNNYQDEYVDLSIYAEGNGDLTNPNMINSPFEYFSAVQIVKNN